MTSNLSYSSVKFLDSEDYTINLSRDHYNVYVLGGGSGENSQIVNLPSASTCTGLELSFFYEFKAHTRSFAGTILKGTFFIPTESSYGNTETELYVENYKVTKIMSVGNGWAVLSY